MSCYTEEGAEAAASSNVALGTAGIESIEAYIMDAGNNYRVGHRRWLLYPQTREMGDANIDPPDGSTVRRANASWIFDDNFGTARPATRDGFVAWPPQGFVPHTLIYPRWSFSFPRADFTNATVTVTTNGVALPVFIEPVEIGFGEESIVFVPGDIAPGERRFHERPATDVTYNVTIGNVRLGTITTNFNYTVTVFDPQKSSAPATQVTGPDQPQVGRTNIYYLAPVESATGYEFRVGTLLPHRTIEGAESGMATVNASVSTLYSLVQTNVRASGNAAFHLAHTTPPRPQSFTLKKCLVPSARSELRFQSRLTTATTGQVARVMVSVDEGTSWREIFAQAGDGATGEQVFSQHSISLQSFAGLSILLKFEYGFTFGAYYYIPGANDGLGWYIDDIQFTFAEELSFEQGLETANPNFQFIPPATQPYAVQARAIFYDTFPCEWTPLRVVNAIPAGQAPPAVQIVSIQSTGSTWEIQVNAENVSSGTVFQVERSALLNSTWQVVPQSELQIEISGNFYIYRIPISNQGTGFFRIITN